MLEDICRRQGNPLAMGGLPSAAKLDKGSWGHDGDSSPAMVVGELWTARHPVSPCFLLGHLMSLSCAAL